MNQPNVSPVRWGAATVAASQIYAAGVGIVVLPLYLRYLGSEAYGLVGFFALLLAWTQFLDAGATATLMRESARFRGGAASSADLLGLYKVINEAFLIVALLVGFAVFALSSLIATRWLHAQSLSVETISWAVALMGMTLPLRWLSGLYRGVMLGFERLGWLSAFSFMIATIRFVLVIPVISGARSPALAFFWFQLGVSVIETGALFVAATRQLPSMPIKSCVTSRRVSLNKTMAFSSSMGLATIAWLLITQVDKVLVSANVSLADYGHFALTTLLASAIGIVAAPISQVVLPKLTRLVAQNGRQEALALYRRATRVLCAITTPVAVTLVFLANPAIIVLTGDQEVANSMSTTLGLYAAGNGILAVAAMPYFLQYAEGDLRLHVLGTWLLALLLCPAMAIAVTRNGGLGAGVCWFTGMALYLLVWTPIAHRRFSKGLEIRWLVFDVGVSALPSASVALLARLLIEWPVDRLQIAALLTAVFLCAVTASVCASSSTRSLVADVVRSLRRPLPMVAL